MYKSTVVFAVLLVAVHAKPGYLEVAPAVTKVATGVDIVHPQSVVKAYAPYSDGHYGYGGYGYGDGLGYGYGNGLGYGYGQGLGYRYGGYGHGYGGYGHGYGHATSYSNRVDYPSHPVAVVGYGHAGYYGGNGYGHGGWNY